jgi:phosphate-selective porin OprO/OprP
MPSLPGIVPAPLAPQAPVAGPVFAPKGKENSSIHLEAGWDYGLRFIAPDDSWHIHVGGNVQIDSTWLIGPNSAFLTPSGSTSGVGNASATFLRRARFRFDGDIWDSVDYMLEFDLANAENENDGVQPPSFGNIAGEPNARNVWIQIRDVPLLGNVRFGNQVKPIGMTNNTYQGWLPFLERPEVMDAFYGPFDGGFALGVTSRNHTDDERLTWQFGVYRPATNVFGIALNKGEFGGRITGLPVYQDDGQFLIHTGFGTLDGEVVQNQLRVRARPLLRNAPGYAVPILVDTGEVTGNRQYTLAPEFALVYGPFTVQAEWAGQFETHARTSTGQSIGTLFYQGGYVELLYFLTGEYQPYDKENGVFGRVVPLHNYRWKKGAGLCGLGAWQVGTRYSYLDANSKSIQGGQIQTWAVGLNWYLNPNVKFQFDYILEHRDQPGVPVSWISGVGVRGAYDF